METAAVRQHLGVILCKVCSNVIDTIDSENVVTYYSVCEQPACCNSKSEPVELD